MAKASLLFVGAGDGLALFSNPNNIGRWLKIGQPFREKLVRAVWPLADNPLHVFAAVDGMGLQQSEDGGQSWRQLLDLEAHTIVGARSVPQRLYLSTLAGGVYRSDDAGTTWAPCARGGWPATSVVRLALAHDDPATIFVGANDGSVWRSPDAGASWALFGEPLAAPIAALVAAPSGALLVVAGGLLFQSDQAATWQSIALLEPAAPALAVLAGQAPVLLLALAAGGIARSDDAGATWAAVGVAGAAAEPIDAIVPVSYHIDLAFAGGRAGRLLSSADRGRSWQLVKQDLPPIYSIAVARLS